MSARKNRGPPRRIGRNPRAERPLRRRLSPEARREELLDAVEHVIAEHGYAGASVPLVVARAGTAQGSFYRYFRDLDDAVSALAGRVFGPVGNAAFALDFSNARTSAEVERELIGYYRVLAREIRDHSGLIREILLVALSGRGRLAKQVAEFLSSMRDYASEVAAQHVGKGPFDSGDPAIVGAALVGMVVGAAHEAARLGDGFDADHWARALARFETKAICRPEPRPRARSGATANEGREHRTRARRYR